MNLGMHVECEKVASQVSKDVVLEGPVPTGGEHWRLGLGGPILKGKVIAEGLDTAAAARRGRSIEMDLENGLLVKHS